LACGPGARRQSVTGDGEETPPIGGNATRSPNAATACTSGPGTRAVSTPQRYPDDPAVVITAIAEVPAVGHVERIAENRERAALILNSGSKTLATRLQSGFDIDRPAR